MKNDDEILALRHDFYFFRRSATHYHSGVAFAPLGTRLALDVGCGSGGFTLPLAERAHRVVGLDRNEMLIARARAKQAEAHVTNIEWVIGDIEHLPFEGESIEFVASYNVLHLVNGDPAFGELARCVARGGRLVVRDAIQQPPLPEPLNALRRVFYYFRQFPDYTRAYGVRTALRLMMHHLPKSSELHKHRFTRDEFADLVARHVPTSRLEQHESGAVVYWEKGI